MSVSDVLCSRGYWETLGRVCEQKCQRNPSFPAMALVQAIDTVGCYEDVKGVVRQTVVDENGGGTLIFILWLHRHPQSFLCWQRLVQDFPNVTWPPQQAIKHLSR